MRILSLFDGMSCGQIAINRLGIKDYTYYASEIDKYAIKITQKNYPNTIQVGDVTKLKGSDFKDIDLILCGSPCQGFSFAGKQLAFDDPRSALFFEFIRLLKEIKPKYFLLENVRMKKEYLSIISEQCGVEPYLFNSAKVSAQNRLRYYWTNIDVNKYIDDKGIVLRDILETDPDVTHILSEQKKDRIINSERGKGYFYTENSEKIGTVISGYSKQPTDGSYLKLFKPVKKTERNRRHLKQHHEKSFTMTANMYKGAGNNGMTLVPKKYDSPKQVGIASDINGHDILKRVYSPDGKSPTLNSMGGGNREPKIIVDDIVNFNKNQETKISKMNTTSEKSNCVTTAFGRGGSSKEYLTSVKKKTMALNDQNYWRKITPLEAERLQTVPDNYTEGVSNTQRYKMLGNSFTVDIIAHILKPLSK